MKKSIVPIVNSIFNETNLIKSLIVENNPMSKNIGRKVKFINPCCNVEKYTFTIKSIQKTHSGEIAYRVYSNDFNDSFGRVASFDKVKLI